MKINPIFANYFSTNSQTHPMRPTFTLSKADSFSFTAKKKKVADVGLYDKELKKIVKAELRDDGSFLSIYKGEKLLGIVMYVIEGASEFPNFDLMDNYHPYASVVTRLHDLKAFGSDAYSGIGTTLVKAGIQKSLSNGTKGRVVVNAGNVFSRQIPHKAGVSPIPFYDKLGFEPQEGRVKRDLANYHRKLLEHGIGEELPVYEGLDRGWMYLPDKKIAEYKKEFNENPIYPAQAGKV